MTRAVVPAIGALLAAGCLPYGRGQQARPPQEVPPQYVTAGAEQADGSDAELARERGGRWWQSFGDPELDRLEQQALQSNLDLSAGWARIEQARGFAQQANAARWPQLDAQGRAAYNRDIFAFGTIRSINATASLPVSYEVDWFAKYRAQGNAAHLDAEASRQAFESLAMTTTAQVAEAWYDVVEARARRDLLQDQVDLNETFLELVQLRFQQGITSALDVHQQRQQVANARAQLSLVDAQEETAANRLAVLVGTEPQTSTGLPVRRIHSTLPELPPVPATGLPGDLLEHRPDVRAAHLRVRAADLRAGAAIADRLPSLVLQATPGYTWSKNFLEDDGTSGFIQREIHGFTFQSGAVLNIPLFDGFRRRGVQTQREAETQEQLASYGQTLRQAMLEVQNAMAREAQQQQFIEDLEQQVEIAGDTLEAARDRYRQGLTDYLQVLTALQTQQQVEQQLLGARRELISARIQLHRALGGTWTMDLEEPEAASAGAG